jgi:hypothetical protein
LKGKKNYSQKIDSNLMAAFFQGSVFSDAEIDRRQDGRAFN